MGLSATRRCISPEEKVRRMAEGRCYRCGGLGHMVRDYPLGQRTLQAAAAYTIPPPAVAVPAPVVVLVVTPMQPEN